MHCRADANGDGLVDGRDIQELLGLMVGK